MIRARSVPLRLAALVATLPLVFPGVALADEPTGSESAPLAREEPEAAKGPRFDWGQLGAEVVDVVLLRPMGFCAALAGSALFLVAAPLSAPSRNIGTSFDFLVKHPAEYTFVRPLGEF